jgi:hypothetical protein
MGLVLADWDQDCVQLEEVDILGPPCERIMRKQHLVLPHLLVFWPVEAAPAQCTLTFVVEEAHAASKATPTCCMKRRKKAEESGRNQKKAKNSKRQHQKQLISSGQLTARAQSTTW